MRTSSYGRPEKSATARKLSTSGSSRSPERQLEIVVGDTPRRSASLRSETSNRSRSSSVWMMSQKAPMRCNDLPNLRWTHRYMRFAWLSPTLDTFNTPSIAVRGHQYQASIRALSTQVRPYLRNHIVRIMDKRGHLWIKFCPQSLDTTQRRCIR